MKRFILTTIVAFVLSGCKSDEEILATGTSQTSYLVTGYILIDEVSYDNTTIKFSGDRIRDHKTSDMEKFKYFSEFYNDTSYTGHTYPGSNDAIAYPFDKITMSCYSEFDAKHPAGTPLDDIVKVKFESYWNYIQNGYQYPDWCKKGLQLGRCSFEYLLSEINNDNSKLICWPDSPTITFTSSPTTPGEYTFTLELTTNGETFTTTFTHKFE